MHRLIALALLFSAPAWSAFAFKRSLTTDHTQAGTTNSSNFTVKVSISDATFKDAAHGGNVQSSTAADVIFYSDSGGTAQIASEIDFYDNVNGILIAHVLISSLSHTADVVFYVFYDNASPPSRTTNPWDANFVEVQHFPNGSSITFNDSTSSPANGTNHGATAVTGNIDGGAGVIAASSQYVDLGTPSKLAITGNITISAWVKANTLPSGGSQYFTIVEKGYDGTNEAYSFTFQNDSNTGNQTALFVGSYDGSGHGGYWVYGSNITTGNWYHLAGRWDGSNWRVLKCGVVPSQSGAGTQQAPVSSTAPVSIGASDINGTESRFFDGSLDEVRISNTARSDDWLLSECNNQTSGSTFLTVGAQTPVGGGGGAPPGQFPRVASIHQVIANE